MIPTSERSRICRHSSKPSASGSIRSSSTMSGSSVSSSLGRACRPGRPPCRSPARPGSTGSGRRCWGRPPPPGRGCWHGITHAGRLPGRCAGTRAATSAGRGGRGRNRRSQARWVLGGPAECRWPRPGARSPRPGVRRGSGCRAAALQFDAAAVRFDDSVRDGQAEPGPPVRVRLRPASNGAAAMSSGMPVPSSVTVTTISDGDAMPAVTVPGYPADCGRPRC